MKPTQEQLDKLVARRYDNEVCHCLYDELMEKRLEELDPEYLSSLKEAVKGVSF